MQFNAQFNAGLTGDAAALERSHDETLAHLPATIQRLHPGGAAEMADAVCAGAAVSARAARHLSALPAADLQQAVAGIARVESGVGQRSRFCAANRRRFQDEAQALLRKQKLLQAWRSEVDAFFQPINPRWNRSCTRRMRHGASSCRYTAAASLSIAKRSGAGSRGRASACRCSSTAQRSAAFLPSLFGARPDTQSEPPLLASLRASGQLTST